MSDRSRESSPTPGPRGPSGYPYSRILVDPGWLSQHLDAPDLRLLDVRPREEYDDGHIPGAISAPIAMFKTSRDGVPAMVIPAEEAEELLGRLGISNDSTVMIYERSLGQDSTRLFWTLEYFGHEDVRVLDGGFASWEQQGLPVTHDEPGVQPVRYQVKHHPERLATWKDVKAGIGR
jgi:thiosulfate/3-mercaptopyruvate sulfurtransferase